MSRRLANLTLDTLGDLPQPCRGCVFWELGPAAAQRVCAQGDPALEKEAWLSGALLDWGSCGKLVYADDVPAGYIVFAPPYMLPGGHAFPTAPASPDAVLLAAARVMAEYAGGGLGRMLVQGAARDLVKRGVRAIEAFGDARPDEPDPRVESGRFCAPPADFLRAVGFKTVRPHHRYPRLRLELRTTQSWRSDVEYALAKLLDAMHPGQFGTGPLRLRHPEVTAQVAEPGGGQQRVTGGVRGHVTVRMPGQAVHPGPVQPRHPIRSPV